MDLLVEIEDEFKELSPSERSETMSKLLSQFQDRMLSSNTRILTRVLDIIAETEGDDELHLDMLATHLEKDSSEVLFAKKWPGEMKQWSGITRLSDFIPQTGENSYTGLRPWKHDPNGRKLEDDQAANSLIEELIRGLEQAVRKNASRELLGSTAETLELPADFCELMKHTNGVAYANLDRGWIVCDFGNTYFWRDNLNKSLDKMLEYAGTDDFEVAAGWEAGDNYWTSWAHYLLCRNYDGPEDEPWHWRIFVNNIDRADYQCFDNLADFLDWYGNAYDRVNWKLVKMDVGQLHKMGTRARALE